jgi:putative redox protein
VSTEGRKSAEANNCMARKNAVVVQIKGNTYAAKADSNHWVIMDTHPRAGGQGGGASPKELLLFALGGCTSSDIVSILRKKRLDVKHFEVHLRAVEREEHPKIFTEVHMEYLFYGDDLPESEIEKAIELSTKKYCGVSAMVQSTVTLTHSYRIEPADRMPLQADENTEIKTERSK